MSSGKMSAREARAASIENRRRYECGHGCHAFRRTSEQAPDHRCSHNRELAFVGMEYTNRPPKTLAECEVARASALRLSNAFARSVGLMWARKHAANITCDLVLDGDYNGATIGIALCESLEREYVLDARTNS